MKWDYETNIYSAFCVTTISLIMLLTTVIYIYFAYMLQSSSKFTVQFLRLTFWKTWLLKCELSNIARDSSLFPKSRSISEHFTLQQDNAPAHRAYETVVFLSRNTPDYIAPWLWPPNSPHYSTKCGVCSKNVCTVPGFEMLTIWSSGLSKSGVTSTRESLTEQSISGVFDCTSVFDKRRPLWAQTVINIVLRDFSMLESWVFGVSI